MFVFEGKDGDVDIRVCVGGDANDIYKMEVLPYNYSMMEYEPFSGWATREGVTIDSFEDYP